MKCLFDVYSCFGTHLEVGKRAVFNLRLYSFTIDLPLVIEITLIAENDGDGLLLLAVEAEIDPLVEIVEGAFVSIVSRVLVMSKTMKATEASLR